MSLPILYDKMETNFKHLGLGVLKDAISCLVTEERNGIFELEMEYPIDGALFNWLENDRIIKVDAGHELKNQQFRIKQMNKKMDGVVQVYAEHVSYLTKDLSLTPNVSLNGNGQRVLEQWKDQIIDENPFTVFSDIQLERETSLSIQDFDNARHVLGGIQGSILDIWNGEYKFDNYHISLLENRGNNANTLISYGRNLTDLQQEENISNTYTSLYPYAVYREFNENGNDSKEIIITLDELIVDSQHVDKYPTRRIMHIDFSSEFSDEEMPTQSRLRSLAQQYIRDNEVGVPKVSLTVSFVDLTKELGFEGLFSERVNLCDVVPVYFENLGIRARAKINRIRWNVLLDQYDLLEIGDSRISLSDKIRDMEDSIHNINNRPPTIAGENIANIPPSQVTGFKAYGGFSQIHLFWDNQGIHVEYFELYASVVSDFVPNDFDRIYRGRANAFSHIVDTNRQYFYRCRAVNHHGVVGEWSIEVSAQTANTKKIDELEGDLITLEDALEENEQRLSGVRDLMDHWQYMDSVEIDGGAIRAETITARAIEAGTITSLEIASDTIVANNIQAGAIIARHIGANQIVANAIDTNAIQARHIQAGAIVADKIASGAIQTVHMQAGSINGDRIQTNTLNANRISTGTLTGVLLRSESGNNRIDINNGEITINPGQSGTLAQVASRINQGSFRVFDPGRSGQEVGGVIRLQQTSSPYPVHAVSLAARRISGSSTAASNGYFSQMSAQFNQPSGQWAWRVQVNGASGTLAFNQATFASDVQMNAFGLSGDVNFKGVGDVDLRDNKVLKVRNLGTTGFVKNTKLAMVAYTVDGMEGTLIANQYPNPQGGFWIGEDGQTGLMMDGVVKIS